MRLRFTFISSTVLDEKPLGKRISFILGKVKDGTILITDGVMKPDEEMALIKETMRKVDSGFPGIEVASLKKPTKGFQRLVEGMMDQSDKIKKLFSVLTGTKIRGSSLKTGMTLIGPAKYIKEIKKNPNSFSVLTEV